MTTRRDDGADQPHWTEPYPDRVADLPSGRYEARLWSYTDGSRALEISPLPENVGKHGVWSGRSLHFIKPADLLTMTHREALELRDAAYEVGARSRDRTIKGQDEAINALMGRCVDLQQELAALHGQIGEVLREHNAPDLSTLSQWMLNLARANDAARRPSATRRDEGCLHVVHRGGGERREGQTPGLAWPKVVMPIWLPCPEPAAPPPAPTTCTACGHLGTYHDGGSCSRTVTTRWDDGADEPRCGIDGDEICGCTDYNGVRARIAAAPPPAPTEDVAALVARLRERDRREARWSHGGEEDDLYVGAADALERLAAQRDLAELAEQEAWRQRDALRAQLAEQERDALRTLAFVLAACGGRVDVPDNVVEALAFDAEVATWRDLAGRSTVWAVRDRPPPSAPTGRDHPPAPTAAGT